MTTAKRRRGKFIVLEGIDGSGTTTQLRHVGEWLTSRGELVHETFQPSSGPFGAQIRLILRGRLVATPGRGKVAPVDPAVVALLFAADRLDHLHNEIQPHLEAGHHVLCDRYVMSSFAYQGLDTDLRFVRQINDKALAPDLTVFLRVRPDVAMARIEGARLERDSFEKLGVQRKVAKAYEDVLTASGKRWGPVVTIDGEEPVSKVRQNVRAAVDSLLA